NEGRGGRAGPLRGHHRLDDAGGARDAGADQRKPAAPDRAGQRHPGRRREPAPQAARAAEEDDEGPQADGGTDGQAQGRASVPQPITPSNRGDHVAVHIRLRRTGTTRKPTYRVVVADSRAARDGRFIEIIGHYNPLSDPPLLKIEAEKATAWIKKGAQPSNTVKHLLKRAGVGKV